MITRMGELEVGRAKMAWNLKKLLKPANNGRRAFKSIKEKTNSTTSRPRPSADGAGDKSRRPRRGGFLARRGHTIGVKRRWLEE